jgi:hypothetical protein
MTSVQILPIPGERGGIQFHAVSGEQRADAETAGQALDAISLLLPRNETAVVVVQPFVEDEFFTASQSTRLNELMASWRQCRDAGTGLAAAEQAELEALVEAELVGAARRSAALSAALSP